MDPITVSPEFRRQAVRCVLTILLFIVVYFVLLGLAFYSIYAAGIAAFWLVVVFTHWITIIIGVGMVAMGCLLVAFMLKFLFQRNDSHEEGDILIGPAEEPALFSLIDEVVSQLDVKPPKKVFLTPEVNASVVYNSSFWSMFFPVRKNLRIGLGLLNALNRDELQAVIAHEFGHFSQRSMAVGSYVYTVNYVIHNLVNDDEDFNKLVGQVASISAFMYPLVWIAVKAVQAARWLLAKIYGLVNLSYLSLSREMEYHADAVAASLGGAHGLADGLRRLDLAQNCYQRAIGFAATELGDGRCIPDLYLLQTDLLRQTAIKDGLTMRGELPVVAPQDHNRYLKSKLEIGQQWASHPEIEDRIAHLGITGANPAPQDPTTAINLLTVPAARRQELTQGITSRFAEISECTPLTPADSLRRCRLEEEKNVLPEVFNGYFDNYSLIPKAPLPPMATKTLTAAQLFSDEQVEQVNDLTVLFNDTALLTAIRDGELNVKTFDYEGKKYRRRQADDLLTQLTATRDHLDEVVNSHRDTIIANALGAARERGREQEMRTALQAFIDIDQAYDQYTNIVAAVRNGGEFMQHTLPVEEIRLRIKDYQPTLTDFRKALTEMMASTTFSIPATALIRKDVEAFLASSGKLFGYDTYHGDAINELAAALDHADYLKARGYWLAKRELLVLVAEVLE